MINIAKLLKDCPKGTKLYTPLFNKDKEFNCWIELLDNTTESRVRLFQLDSESPFKVTLENDGSYCANGECVLFPSKDVRDWGCFHVKYVKGVVDKGKEIKALLVNAGGIDNSNYSYDREDYVYYIDQQNSHIRAFGNFDNENNPEYNYILSTGTELKLEEKEPPKFKVGDVVRKLGSKTLYCVCDRYTDNKYQVTKDYLNCFSLYALATRGEIAKWNKETLEPNHLHYSTSKRKIIHWFLPFDKVVARINKGEWMCSLFSHKDNQVNGYFLAAFCNADECLPYNEETAKLIGTTKDFDNEIQY